MSKILATTTAVIAIFIFVQTGFAATISVEPTYQEVLKGENFTVNISVNPEGSEVVGAQYKLHFNNMLLNATSLISGTFFDGLDTMTYGEGINNTIGRIDYGEAISVGDIGVTNPGTLTTITFQAIAERGISELRFDVAKLSGPYITPITTEVNNGSVKINTPPTSFMVCGCVYYEDGSECNYPHVKITNLNTNEKWDAKTSTTSNYYQLILVHDTNINATEILQFEVTSPDGSQSNTTSHNVTLEEIDNGGLFDFNISLEAKPSIFDTGKPDNPYPSIMGVHNGTIIPDRLIEANRIYTYACSGTGGHTEYARIWGNDVDAHAIWSGYVDDWHNLSFNRTFTLEPGVEYNYTIKTGSYPQIHHTDKLEVDNGTTGTITCITFIDANGRSYNNWIPAIRLWRE
jgi:hypothetical protein